VLEDCAAFVVQNCDDGVGVGGREVWGVRVDTWSLWTQIGCGWVTNPALGLYRHFAQWSSEWL